LPYTTLFRSPLVADGHRGEVGVDDEDVRAGDGEPAVDRFGLEIAVVSLQSEGERVRGVGLRHAVGGFAENYPGPRPPLLPQLDVEFADERDRLADLEGGQVGILELLSLEQFEEFSVAVGG